MEESCLNRLITGVGLDRVSANIKFNTNPSVFTHKIHRHFTILKHENHSLTPSINVYILLSQVNSKVSVTRQWSFMTIHLHLIPSHIRQSHTIGGEFAELRHHAVDGGRRRLRAGGGVAP